MVHDDKPVGLDGVQVEFDDERVVCDAGVMVVATLAQRLDVEALAQQVVRLRRDRPGAANAGRKVMALIYAMVLGADSIDDVGVLRAGRTGRLLGGWVPAPRRWGRSCARSRSGMCDRALLIRWSKKPINHDALLSFCFALITWQQMGALE